MRTPWCRLRKRLWRCSRCRPSNVLRRFLGSKYSALISGRLWQTTFVRYQFPGHSLDTVENFPSVENSTMSTFVSVMKRMNPVFAASLSHSKCCWAVLSSNVKEFEVPFALFFKACKSTCCRFVISLFHNGPAWGFGSTLLMKSILS